MPGRGHHKEVEKKVGSAGKTVGIYYAYVRAHKPKNWSRTGFIVATTKGSKDCISDLRAESERGCTPINEFVREARLKGKQLELVMLDRIPEDQKAEARNCWIRWFTDQETTVLNTSRRVSRQQVADIPAEHPAPGWEYVERYKAQGFATFWERSKSKSEPVVNCTIHALSKVGLYLKHEQGTKRSLGLAGRHASKDDWGLFGNTLPCDDNEAQTSGPQPRGFQYWRHSDLCGELAYALPHQPPPAAWDLRADEIDKAVGWFLKHDEPAEAGEWLLKRAA